MIQPKGVGRQERLKAQGKHKKKVTEAPKTVDALASPPHLIGIVFCEPRPKPKKAQEVGKGKEPVVNRSKTWVRSEARLIATRMKALRVPILLWMLTLRKMNQ